ncbi:putative quinone oxidoreductase [Paramyrothecium foliicola]|nr:putative quinone oxidoreductase [Paramyrothecium foliicola]
MSPVPKTMKAVQFSRTGGVEVLEHNDIPVPSPVPEGHVLIRNRFAGVNYIDTYFRSGLYKAPSLPLTLGREGSGEVVEVHSSVGGGALAPGTRVVYMSVGSYAEYVAVPAEKVLPVPDGVSLEDAAAAMLQGLTALTLIREAANVQPGQWTLVHAAAGGVGILLVQMLRALGAKVIGTASTEEKCALARKHGAEWTINSNDDVVAKVNEITNGHGIDAILDGVGKATFEADLKMIALKGHLVSFGNASGAVPPVNLLDLSAKNVKLVRPTLFGYLADRADWEKYTTELFDLVASKKLEILIHKVYDLADSGSAHTDIESRKTTGKLLIKCD